MKWCIALIDFKKLNTIDPGLKGMGLKYELGIPTVVVLRKRFKNKEFFERVPLMFNYGFIKLPNKVAKNRDRLIKIKDRIPGIFSWMFKSGYNDYAVEHVPESIVIRLMRLGDNLSIFSKGDLERVKKGDLITLKGYPFDGLPAEIINIDHKARKVRVNLFIMEAFREVTVSFDNVFYSIYKDFDEALSNNSIDGIEAQYKNALDKFQFKNLSNDKKR